MYISIVSAIFIIGLILLGIWYLWRRKPAKNITDVSSSTKYESHHIKTENDFDNILPRNRVKPKEIGMTPEELGIIKNQQEIEQEAYLKQFNKNGPDNV